MILIYHWRFTRRKTQEPTTGFERSDRAEVLLLLKVKNLHELDIFQPIWLKLGTESLNGRTYHMHTIYPNQPTTQPPY